MKDLSEKFNIGVHAADTQARLDIGGESLNTSTYHMNEWVWLLILVSLPIALQFSGAYELFPPPGWVDPMIYIGYSLNPHQQIQNLGTYYYSQRIPFIAVGHFFHAVFSPAYAHLGQGVLFQSVAIFSLYTIGKRACSRIAGIASAWWLATNPLWIASIASGYVDGPAIAMSLCAIALFLASKNQSQANSRTAFNFLSGSAIATVLALHPLPALFACIALLIILLMVQTAYSSKFRTIVTCSVGVFFAILLMAVYSQSIGGPFFFLLSDHHPINNALAGRALLFSRSLETWMPQAFRLAMPFVLLASFVLHIATAEQADLTNRKALARAAIITMLASIILIVVWDFGIGGLMAQSWFYASYFLIGESLLVVFLITSMLASSMHLPYQALTILVPFAFAAVGIVIFQETIAQTAAELGGKDVWYAIICATAALLLAIWMRLKRGAMLIMLGLTMSTGIANGDTRFIFTKADSVPFRTFFELALEVRHIVDQNNLHGRRTAVWANRYDYPSNDIETNQHATYQFSVANQAVPLTIHDSIAGLWLWDKGSLNLAMPELTPANNGWLSVQDAPTSVILVCAVVQTCELGQAKLEQAGLSPTVRSRSMIWKQDLNPVTVIILDYTFIKQ